MNSILNTTIANTTITIGSMLLLIFVSFVFAIIISLTYIISSKGKHSPTLALTLIVLPAIISAVVLLIGNNIAGAFSLAGIFTVIRFRSAPGNAKDIVFILFCVAAGLACGVEAYLFGAILTIVLCAAVFLMGAVNFAMPKSTRMQLRVIVPEDFNGENVFDDILCKYAKTFSLDKMRTKDLGSTYELSYEIDLFAAANRKEFIDELRCRNGNLNISLSKAETAGEF